jgi:hypothetical protein
VYKWKEQRLCYEILEWAGEPCFAAFGGATIKLNDTYCHQDTRVLLEVYGDDCPFAR